MSAGLRCDGWEDKSDSRLYSYISSELRSEAIRSERATLSAHEKVNSNMTSKAFFLSGLFFFRTHRRCNKLSLV